MNYLLNLCRLPILSLVLSSLFLGSLPAHADDRLSINTPTSTRIETNLLTDNRSPATNIALAQTKVSPQLEQQILQVIRKNPAIILEVLQKYAIEQQQKEQQAQADTFKTARKQLTSLIGDSPTMGAKDRKIVMVEFSDFQCPYCATASVELKKFMAKHQDKVTLVYKHFPLTQIHPEALPAARAAWAANKQGKFWEYHDALFANQAKLSESLYLEIATKLKLDLNRFNADRKLADNSITTDFALGRKVGVEGTPTFILNGEVVAGSASLADLEKALAEASKK
jgi:protein-disulfide isomerase